MKKIIMIVIAFVFLFSSLVDSIAACPPGFSPAGTVTQHVNPNCRIVVSYCLSEVPGSLETYDVFISEVAYFGNCVLQTNPPSYPPVNWEFVLSSIVIANQPVKFDLGLCPDETIQIRMFNGSCFWKQEGFRLNENGEWEYGVWYEPCSMEGLFSCRQYYTTCLLQDGENYVVVTSAGPIQPLFSCVDVEGNCKHLCE